MSGQDPTGDGQKLEALARQLADLERESAELTAAIQSSAGVRKMLVLVVVILLAVYGYLYYTTGKALMAKNNRDQLLVELRARAQVNSKEITDQAHLLVERTWPRVSEAFNNQLKHDMPSIMNKLGTERETLAVNLKDRLEGK